MPKTDRYRPTVDTGTECLTKQSDREHCDPKLIIERHVNQGIPLPTAPQPVFMDLTRYDFENHRNIVAEVTSAFEELPSDVRDACENNPANYVDVLDTNAQQIAEHGLDEMLRRWREEGEVSVSAETDPAPAGAQKAIDGEESAASSQ